MNASDLLDVARRLDRLSPSRTNPHAFFEERSGTSSDTLKRWAADLRAVPSSSRRALPVPSRTPRAQPVPSPLPARPTALAARPTHQRPLFMRRPYGLVLPGVDHPRRGRRGVARRRAPRDLVVAVRRDLPARPVCRRRHRPAGPIAAGRWRPRPAACAVARGSRAAGPFAPLGTARRARPAPSGHRWGVALAESNAPKRRGAFRTAPAGRRHNREDEKYG